MHMMIVNYGCGTCRSKPCANSFAPMFLHFSNPASVPGRWRHSISLTKKNQSAISFNLFILQKSLKSKNLKFRNQTKPENCMCGSRKGLKYSNKNCILYCHLVTYGLILAVSHIPVIRFWCHCPHRTLIWCRIIEKKLVRIVWSFRKFQIFKGRSEEKKYEKALIFIGHSHGFSRNSTASCFESQKQ